MTTADKTKIALAGLIVVLGFVAFYYFGDQPAIALAGILIATFAAAIAVFYQTAAGKATWEFTKAARGEMRKVVWPNNKETVQVTLVVFAMVVLLAIFLWFVDWSLLKVMRLLTGQKA
jgi:preprotein translocase subunit SecE